MLGPVEAIASIGHKAKVFSSIIQGISVNVVNDQIINRESNNAVMYSYCPIKLVSFYIHVDASVGTPIFSATRLVKPPPIQKMGIDIVNNCFFILV